MKSILHKFIIFFLALSVAACGDFGDLNSDPNKPITVSPASLLTSAERSVSDVVGSYFGTLYSQQITNITYTDDDRYGAIQVDFSGWYTGPLANLQRVIDLNTDPDTRDLATSSGSNANQIAVARILKAYFYHHITDRWGPIPYSDALKAEDGVLTPAYDSQQAIYEDMVKELKEAVAQIDGGAGPTGDFIFNGDMNEWRKFANTARLVIALRMADANENLARTEFQSAVNDGLIDADVYYPYLAEAANENPWFTRFRTREDFAVTTLVVEGLMNNGDPRLGKFADYSLNSVATGNPQHVGMPYGLSNPGAQPHDVSFPNSTYVKAQDSPLPIFTLAQVHFSMAEAVVRGWINGNAEEHYQAGIRASWDQWDVSYDDAAFNAYYNQAAVQWNAAEWEELLGYQKWVALFIQGYEAWAEWRRLDYPTLTVPEDPLNPSGGIPVRNMYPAAEANLNKANYDAGVVLLGGPDRDDTRLWWDTK